MFYTKEIREAMVMSAKDREIAVRYNNGFGKRPDVLKYPDEVLDLIKQGATSFHASEERWTNPNLISSDRKVIEKLRRGWDLILDIDSPYWKISKITAWLIIKGLQNFNVKGISVKFSGNKGFHIGVAFESFPEEYKGELTRKLFPEAPRSIASFLLDYITSKYIKVSGNNEIIFGEGLNRKFKISYEKLQEWTGKKIEELTVRVCSACNNEITEEGESKVEFHCSKCGGIETGDKQYMKCPKCDILMEKIESKKNLCDCGSNDYYVHFNALSIIEVDTLLISSRHLFRMPYSLHEKSGLVSIPFNPEKILEFEKKFAKPEIVRVSKHIFIDREKAKPNEAKELLEKAMIFTASKEKEDVVEKSFEALEEAVPEVLFPPCIKKILSGLEDGRKRAVFILINFLKCVGWPYDEIEKRIKEWNTKNPEPLKEQIILGQLRYQKKKENILPPNCDNKVYYKDFRVCMPDSFCKRIKNPANYAILKSKIGKK